MLPCMVVSSRTGMHRRAQQDQASAVRAYDPTHLHDARGVLAGCAVELVLLQVGHRDEAAGGADVHAVRVTLVKQPLLRGANGCAGRWEE